jgi:Zn ribbon nucleic-acid-binding protein
VSRFACPECRADVKVSDREWRARVECAKCGYRMSLFEAEESGKKKRKKKKASPYVKYLVWAPPLAAFMISAPLALASLLWEKVLVFAIVIEIVALIASLAWGAYLASDDGAYVGFDYFDLSGQLRLIFLILLIGLLPFVLLYFLGYVLYLYFTVIQFGIRHPSRYAPVAAAQGIGLFFLIVVLPTMYVLAGLLANG